MGTNKEYIYSCDNCTEQVRTLIETDSITTAIPSLPEGWYCIRWETPRWMQYIACSPRCLYDIVEKHLKE